MYYASYTAYTLGLLWFRWRGLSALSLYSLSRPMASARSLWQSGVGAYSWERGSQWNFCMASFSCVHHLSDGNSAHFTAASGHSGVEYARLLTSNRVIVLWLPYCLILLSRFLCLDSSIFYHHFWYSPHQHIVLSASKTIPRTDVATPEDTSFLDNSLALLEGRDHHGFSTAWAE